MDYNRYSVKEGYDSFRTYMMEDEEILWKGKPAETKKRSAESALTGCFGIFWLGFSIFWTIGVGVASGGIMGIFGLPFVAFGIYLVFGRPVHEKKMRKNTYYMITDKKIMKSYKGRVETIDGRNLPHMTIDGYGDGIGTVYFGERTVYYRNGKTRTGYAGGYFHLENIPVRDVQEAIDNLIKANNQ